MRVPTIKPEWLVGITMTSEQKSKWLDALRSGLYCQGKYDLYNAGCYCCLGVYAAVVAGLSGAELEGKSELCHVGLNKALGPWSDGFSHIVPATWTTIQCVLAGLNDNEKSFSEIADFIEANIPACDAAPVRS